MNRRDLLIGGACLAAVGGSELLRPHKVVKLKDETKLADLVPRRFDHWTSEDGGEIVLPKTPNSLSSRLYSDTVARIYSPIDGETNPPVMLVIAYGSAQNDLLQLHRPESCYPAVGFSVTHRRLAYIPLGRRVMLPGVELTALNSERTEDIVYWTRLGEYLPQTAAEQRSDRFKTAMQGIVSDGMLVRCSTLRTGAEPQFKALYGFISELVNSINPLDRKAFIGTRLNRKMGSAINVDL